MIDLNDLAARCGYVSIEWMGGCWSVTWGDMKDGPNGMKMRSDWVTFERIEL